MVIDNIILYFIVVYIRDSEVIKYIYIDEREEREKCTVLIWVKVFFFFFYLDLIIGTTFPGRIYIFLI